MKNLNISVKGLPKGQPRVKAAHRNGFTRVYTPATADDWKGCIGYAVGEAVKHELVFPLFEGPVRVDITVIFPRLKAHFNSKGEIKPGAPTWHIAKPDRDNLEKGILDKLTQCQVFKDDAQVCAGEVIKRYAGAGEATGAKINILALE
mgnify:FL=1